MLVKEVSLTNFRNHSTHNLKCKSTTNLILGANGCGKTSVLEAIYILTQGKSFRATDPDILKRGTDFYRIELTYDNGKKITAFYDGTKKVFQSMDKKTARLSKKDKYPVILFLPSDLNLVTGSPTSRRDYFNRFFSVLSQDYATALSKYDKALTQRNKLLKDDFVKKDAFFPWNVLLAKNGIVLRDLRKKFIDEINENLTNIYHSIADNEDKISLEYSTEFESDSESEFLKALEDNFEKDQIIGHTSIGFQRDNFDFIFNDNPAAGSASRGESRSIILALKFNEANIVTEKLNTKPLILLDDVFSELDNDRRACLIDNFKNHQVIITSVEKFTI